ncbi:MAG: hypothetical protein ACK4P3_06730, partial [Fimbriimonadaceae bacterium]
VFSGSSSEARILYMQTNGTVDAVRVFSLSADWEPVLVGDFAGNSRGGILWQNVANDRASMFLMTTRTNYDSFNFDNVPLFAEWEARFAVDLNNNGRQDIVWYNPSTNQSAIWMMNGFVVESSAVYGLPVNWSLSEVRSR